MSIESRAGSRGEMMQQKAEEKEPGLPDAHFELENGGTYTLRIKEAPGIGGVHLSFDYAPQDPKEWMPVKVVLAMSVDSPDTLFGEVDRSAIEELRAGKISPVYGEIDLNISVVSGGRIPDFEVLVRDAIQRAQEAARAKGMRVLSAHPAEGSVLALECEHAGFEKEGGLDVVHHSLSPRQGYRWAVV